MFFLKNIQNWKKFKESWFCFFQIAPSPQKNPFLCVRGKGYNYKVTWAAYFFKVDRIQIEKKLGQCSFNPKFSAYFGSQKFWLICICVFDKTKNERKYYFLGFFSNNLEKTNSVVHKEQLLHAIRFQYRHSSNRKTKLGQFLSNHKFSTPFGSHKFWLICIAPLIAHSWIAPLLLDKIPKKTLVLTRERAIIRQQNIFSWQKFQHTF